MPDDQFSKRLEELFSGAGRVSPDPQQPPAPPAAPFSLPADAAAQVRLAEMQAAVAEAERRAADEQAQRAAAAAEVQRLHASVAEAQRLADQEQARRASAAAQLETLQAKLAALEAAGRQSAASAASAITAAEAQAQARLTQMQAAVTEAQRRAEQEQAERVATAFELQALQTKLADMDAAQRQMPPAAVTQADARLAELQAAVAEARQRAEAEQVQRAAATLELLNMQAKLAELEAAQIAAPRPVEPSLRPLNPADASTFASQPTNIFDLAGLTRPARVVEQELDAKRQAAAFRTALLTLAGLVLFGVVSTFNYLRTGETAHLVGAVTIFAAAAVVGLSAGLIRRGRRALGVWLILGAMLGTSTLIVLLLGGLGVLLAVFNLAIVSAIASQSLDSRQTTRVVVVVALGGLALILLDVFGAATRLAVASPAVVYTAIALLLAIYGFILVREFANYTLRTKIVLGVLLTAGPAVMALAYFALARAQSTQTVLSGQLSDTVSQQAEAQLRNTVVAQGLSADTDLKAVSDDVLALADYRASLGARSATLGQGAYWDAHTRVVQLPGGQWGNAAGGVSSVFVPAGVPMDDRLLADLNVSAYLDFVAPAILRAHPSAVALYFISPQGATTYYPNIDLANLVDPQFDPTTQPFYTIATPANDPERLPAWTVPYQDPAGTGLIVTSAAPVYTAVGDFGGVLAADVQLSKISAQLAQIKAGQSGYAFLIDSLGRIIAMPVAGYQLFGLRAETVAINESPKQTVLGHGGQDLQRITRRMIDGETGLETVTLDGVATYVAYAPLPSIGYSLAVVVPRADLTGAVAAANAQIAAQTQETIRLGVLLLMGLLLVAALISVGIGQVIAAPLVRLTQTANQITAGHLTAQARVETEDEAGLLARAFNTMTAQLRSILQGMEQRVAERTRDLSLAAEVGQRVSSVRDVGALLSEAAETVRARFGLYYAQVYLTNPAGTTLLLRAGTGAVGRELLQRGHRLPLGPGSINGSAATEKHPVLVEDTHLSSVFRPNPLLPETRSEVAVPLMVGERVVGVLDLQSARAGAFSAENLPAFQALAGQLAVAIENASLFASAEQARSDVEQQARRLSRESWRDFLNAVERSEHLGYSYDQTALTVETEAQAASAPTPGALQVPIVITGAQVGALYLEPDAGREWGAADKELAEAVARQVAQQVESLRLLADSEQARATAEQATRRLTRESWQEFGQDVRLTPGYEYDLNQVRPLADGDGNSDDSAQVSQPLVVRGETVGELQVLPGEPMGEAELDLVASVAGQLSAHIENLRLYTQAEINAEQARTLIEHAPEAVVVVDVDSGLFTEPNRNAELLYGLPRSELVKFGPAQMSPEFQPDGRPSLEKAIEKITEAMNGGAPVFEWLHRNAQGEDIPCEIRLVRLPAPGRSLVRASVTNISERKRAQESLAKRAVELATVAEVSTVASTILEAERLLQEVVDLTKERFGLYHAHVYLIDETQEFLHLAVGAGDVGRQLVAQRHTIPTALPQSLVARAARTSQPVVVNDVRADPGFLPNPLLPATRSELALPLTVGAHLLGVLDVQSDVTGRFAAEDVQVLSTLAAQVAVALQNAYLYAEQAATVTRLREIDHLKSSFLANMSHELRTPLNSILGFTDVMLEGLDGPITDRMDTDLKVIQKNGQHLLTLINDVLDMAKIEAGKLQLSPETFNFEEVLDEVLSITAPLADAKALHLRVDPASSPDLDLEADRFRLRQVMLNLVNNAIKFTEAGQITITATRSNGNVRVAVHDTGLGIPSEHLELIFQEFTQVDTSTTRKTGGTGLGLPISRKLVELHGGRLWAESEGVPGQGSTFIMELPVESRYLALPERDLA